MSDETRLRARMTALARTFPSMRNAPGIDPWHPESLQQWGAGPASQGERITARFLLSVWDRRLAWEQDPFDVMEALQVWDSTHRLAFFHWLAEPWWA